jgi:hypothetical protein
MQQLYEGVVFHPTPPPTPVLAIASAENLEKAFFYSAPVWPFFLFRCN